MFGGKVKSIRNLRPSTAHPIFTASSQSPRHGFLFFCFEASRPVAGQVSESAQHPGGRRAKGRAVAVGVWERWKRESVVMVFGIVARER